MPRVGGNPRETQSPFQSLSMPEVPSLQTHMLSDDDMQPAPQKEYQVNLGGDMPKLPSIYTYRNGELVEADNDQYVNMGDGDNLAEFMEEDELNRIGQRIKEDTDRDITEREPWRRRFENGLAMMGLIEDDLDDGAFPGASNVIHPLLAEAIVNFWARFMGELFPPEGPAKGKVYGKQTQALLDSAARISEYLNYEMTEEDEAYIDESSRLSWNLPIAGNAFRKTFFDPLLQHNVGIFVSVDDMIVPAEATSLATTPRFTHRMKKFPSEVKKLMHAGFYRDIELLPPQRGEDDEAQRVKNETADVSPDDDSRDEPYEILESCVELDLDVDPYIDEESGERLDIPRSYFVTVEKSSGRVLSIRRSWKEGDPQCKRRVPFVKYGFVPGFGFYDFGLLHLIGGLQGAATGALRVLLDSAASASLSGGFVASDSGIKGDTIAITPGEWKKVKATSADLQKAFFAVPVKEPSPALFNLLGLLIQGGKSLTATTEAMTGDSDGKNVAVGTINKLIEQGEKVMSTVHRMAFQSLKKELRQRFESCRENMPDDGYPYDVEGDKRSVYKEDFQPGIGIVPVADPNIFSSGQRLAIAQMVYETASANPDVVNKKKAIRRLYEAARVPDVDDLVPDDPQPQPYDPAGEIQAILLNKPILVQPEQPHTAHLQVLWAFASNPQFGANKQVQAQIGPALISVIGQHLAYAWVTANRQAGIPASYMDPESGQVQQPQVPPEQIAAMMAQIAPQLVQAQGLPEIQDGEGQGSDQGAAQAKLLETQGKLEAQRQTLQMKKEEHEFDMQASMQKLQIELEGMHAKMDAKLKEIEQKSQVSQMQAATQIQATQLKAETDRQISQQQADQQAAQLQQEGEMNAARNSMELDNMQRENELSQQQQTMDMLSPEPAPAPTSKPRGRGRRS